LTVLFAVFPADNIDNLTLLIYYMSCVHIYWIILVNCLL